MHITEPASSPERRFRNAFDPRLEQNHRPAPLRIFRFPGRNRRHQQLVQVLAAERAHGRFQHRHIELAIELALRREAQDVAAVVAADPVATFAIDCRAIGPAHRLGQIGKHALVGRYAIIDVVVERPHHAPQRMRIRQVHGAAIGRKAEAVLREQVRHHRL